MERRHLDDNCHVAYKGTFYPESKYLNIFDSRISPISVKQSCTNVNLYCDSDNDALRFLEEWNFRSDLWQHMRSDDFLKILAVMDVAHKLSEISFHTVSSSDGFELVKKLGE